MMFKTSLFSFLVSLLLLLPSPAYPWGSLVPAETHQYIIHAAYDRLKADPAFATHLFPSVNAILGHEGVEWTIGSAVKGGSDYAPVGLSGVGPDASGMSKYSEHYYNPIIQEGNGPDAAARYFKVLVQQNLTGNKGREASGKAAAYSAHFLADMFVPYHVVGSSRATAEKIYKEQTAKHPGEINLGQNIVGSYKLSYLTPFKGGNPNFHTEMFRVVKKTDPAEVDWFDPWYFNGNSEAMMIKTSSHVAWEAFPNGATMISVHNRAGKGLPGYDPNWKNAPVSGFNTNLWDEQARQVQKIALLSAAETRNRLESYYEDPTPALANTIQTVYTMWRASFSGLRPAIEYQPDGPNRYKVTGKIANQASGSVKSLKVRLTAIDCTVSNRQDKAIDHVAAGRTGNTTPWQVTTSDKLCRLKLEVIGSYEIPDLQYAAVERTFFPQQVKETVKAKPQEPIAQDIPDMNEVWVLDKFEKNDKKAKPEAKSNYRKNVSSSYGTDSMNVTAETWQETDRIWVLNEKGERRTFDPKEPRVIKTKIRGSWTPFPRVFKEGDKFTISCRLDISKSDSYDKIKQAPEEKQPAWLGLSKPIFASIEVREARWHFQCQCTNLKPACTKTVILKGADADWGYVVTAKAMGSETEQTYRYKYRGNRKGAAKRTELKDTTPGGQVAAQPQASDSSPAPASATPAREPEASGDSADSSGKMPAGGIPPADAPPLEEVQALVDRGDYRSAFDAANRLIAKSPRSSEAHRLRANAGRHLGNLKAALEDANRAVELDPSNCRAFGGRAAVRRALKDSSGAMADINKALALNPIYHQGHDSRAQLLLEAGDLSGALTTSNRAVELSPQTTMYIVRRATIYRNLKNYAAAIADLNRVITISPKSPEAYFQRGLVRLEQKRWDDVIADNTKALGLNITNAAGAYNNRGLAYKYKGMINEARRDFTHALEIKPNDSIAKGNLERLNKLPAGAGRSPVKQ